MSDFSISITKNQAATISTHDVTEGTATPGAGDIELRIDLTTHAITRRDIQLALEKFQQYFANAGEVGNGSGKLGLNP